MWYLHALFTIITAAFICVVISCRLLALLASSAVININTSTLTQLTGADRNYDQIFHKHQWRAFTIRKTINDPTMSLSTSTHSPPSMLLPGVIRRSNPAHIGIWSEASHACGTYSGVSKPYLLLPSQQQMYTVQRGSGNRCTITPQ